MRGLCVHKYFLYEPSRSRHGFSGRKNLVSEAVKTRIEERENIWEMLSSCEPLPAHVNIEVYISWTTFAGIFFFCVDY